MSCDEGELLLEGEGPKGGGVRELKHGRGEGWCV